MKKLRLHIVAHTHWDREWYLTFEQFRVKLVETIDKLLHILDTNPRYKSFLLDGQTCVIEDYLQIKPKNKEKIKKYVKNGRLQIGPWYVLGDEFLPSGEALIRNLLFGAKVSKEFGNRMNIGYLPDVFGHISQMPQILNGFGINTAVIYRGVNVEQSEFFWQSPDGSQVLAIYLPLGYLNLASLPSDPKEALKKIENVVNELTSWATTPNILLLNGGDHLPPQPELPKTIESVKKELKDKEIFQTTLPEYILEVKKSIKNLAVKEGEFRSARPARITPGVISTRMYLKQQNFECQTLLEKYCEPISIFSWWMGERYYFEMIERAWNYLILNHPHDSICGCSCDEVHKEMVQRFLLTKQIVQEILPRAFESFTTHINTASLSGTSFIVFNPTNSLRTDIVECTIYTDIEDDNFSIVDSKGNHLPFQLILAESKEIKISSVDTRIKEDSGKTVFGVITNHNTLYTQANKILPKKKIRFAFIAQDVPPFGYKTYTMIKKHLQVARLKRRNKIENEFYRIKCEKDGSLTILDKETKTIFANCNTFWDGGDAGDEYTYSPPKKDQWISTRSSEVDIIENGPVRTIVRIKSQMRVPSSLSKNREKRENRKKLLKIESFVTLYPHIKRIDIRTEVENSVNDHILKVYFPTPIQTDYIFSEGQYDVIKRPIKVREDPMTVCLKEGEETEVSTYPHQSFIDVSDGKVGLTIINKGLPEFEAIKTKDGVTVALTLLRCVGWLSRGDLSTRKGNAGPSIPTPDAQCHGSYVFEYALFPHSGTWEEAKSYITAYNFITPFYVMQTDKHTGKLPLDFSILDIQPKELIITAIKKAEEEEATIIRLFNISTKDTEGKIIINQNISKIYLCRLDEKNIKSLTIKKNYIHLKVKAKQIITLKLILN